jgi:ABC-type bacteriocin/lantibiotic exporter with double-glycine peptidase domain
MGTGLVALAGPSGCGKTTVLNLILDLYKPWQGEIHIVDGYLGEMDRLFFKEQVGVSLQEPFLWNDSIENNIRYAKPQATKQEIIKAANIAGVSDFIDDTPQGYDTVVGENACRLSDGQKQKIAIARAIIRKPKILILDEAMSSMDSASEEKIINGIKELLPGSLIIIVSHRLSSVAACDLVYFLKGPDKMVIGKPAELIKDDQDFYNLFSAQIIHHLAP